MNKLKVLTRNRPHELIKSAHQLLCLQLEKLPLSAEHALEKVSFC